MLDWTTIITSTAIATVFASFFAVVVAPHVQWGIEKKRLLRERREQLINSARQAQAIEPNKIERFKRSPEYHAIRQYLDPKLVEKIESNTFQIDMKGAEYEINNFWPEIQSELSRLERKWGLI